MKDRNTTESLHMAPCWQEHPGRGGKGGAGWIQAEQVDTGHVVLAVPQQPEQRRVRAGTERCRGFRGGNRALGGEGGWGVDCVLTGACFWQDQDGSWSQEASQAYRRAQALDA